MENRRYGKSSSMRWAWMAVLALGVIAVLGHVAGGSLLAGDEDEDHDSLAGTYWRVADTGAKGAYLGVSLTEEVDHPEGGARIVRVVDGSPAEEAGLERGDIVIAIGGEVVRGPAALTKKIRDREPGTRIGLRVIREGEKIDLDVELGERPGFRTGGWLLKDGEVVPFDSLDEEKLEEYKERMEEWSERYGETMKEYGERFKDKDWGGAYRFSFAGRPRLGVQLVEATPELREHLGGNADSGVLVSKVVAGSAAENAGILVGDLIIAADGNPVEDSGDLRRALAGKSDEEIVLILIRDGRRMEIEAFIEAPDEDEDTGPRAFLGDSNLPVPPIPPMPEMPALPAMPELPELLVLPELPELPALAPLEDLELLEDLDLEELIHVPEMNLEVRQAIEEAVRRAQEANREAILFRAKERDRLLSEIREAELAREKEFLEAQAEYEAVLDELRDAQEDEMLRSREEYRGSLREALRESTRERRLLEELEILQNDRKEDALIEI